MHGRLYCPRVMNPDLAGARPGSSFTLATATFWALGLVQVGFFASGRMRAKEPSESDVTISMSGWEAHDLWGRISKSGECLHDLFSSGMQLRIGETCRLLVLTLDTGW
jgi:hypothetical protein